MKPEQFIEKYLPFALEVEKETGITAISILAQSALESGWGEKAIGNNLFGIKFKKGDKAFKKVITTEFSDSPNDFKGSDILSLVYDKEINKYRYKIYAYFADYESPKEGFLKHAELLLSERYSIAKKWINDPYKFLVAIWLCGYATAPDYPEKMRQMVNSIERRL